MKNLIKSLKIILVFAVFFYLSSENFILGQSEFSLKRKISISKLSTLKQNIIKAPADIKIFRIFVGSGIHFLYYNTVKENALFTIGITPQLSKNLFLTARIDGHNMQFHMEMNEMLYGVGALYGTGILNTKFSFFAGGVLTFHVLGNRGLDFSIIPQLGIEYTIVKYIAISTEVRKPVYFWKDSGHNQLMLNFNLVIKI